METPQKRVRKSRGKGIRTTSGCLTCRRRHKKCDERRPSCGACSISSRQCIYACGRPGQNNLPNGDARTERFHTAFSVEENVESHINAQPGVDEIVAHSGVSSSDAIAASEPPIVNPILSDAVSSQVRDPAIPEATVFLDPPCERLPQDLLHGSTLTQSPSQVYNVYSPDTVSSDLLNADLASTRWLNLLASDAAQADKTFSLAPTRASSPVTGLNPNATNPATPHSIDSALSSFSHGHRALADGQSRGQAQPISVPHIEQYAWQHDRDIPLSDDEVRLFRTFAERASSWLDVFDPLRHFSTHAVRLAMRNLGLMKAILALTSRYAIAMENISEARANVPIQYYYETLHYVSTALQYASYTRSQELLATAIIISTYEMLDDSNSNWKRHLKGVFWIQRSQDVDGSSGGLRQAVWWAWLRQDLWAAFREKRPCFSFWKPLKDVSELSQDELADRVVYLLSQTVNYCARQDAGSSDHVEAGKALINALERWRNFLGAAYSPMPTCQSLSTNFRPIWIHPPRYALALQVYSFAKILLTLHRPSTVGFQGYLQTQRVLSEAVNTICGVAMELKEEGCQILSAQCLFGAGLCTQEPEKRDFIVSLILSCEARTGWPMKYLVAELGKEWTRST